MEKLISVAQELVQQGEQHLARFGVEQFHLTAQELLTKANLPEAFDLQSLVSASMSHDFKTEQNFKFLEFSDLPITIARGENCFLDIYFWRRRPTVIHNHHFSGAFQCLLGSNVDLEFEYSRSKDLGKHHSLGELKLKNTRTIKSGDVAAIGFLDEFIHQNHHHADLSINACFRSKERGDENLSNFLFSGLRFEKNTELVARMNRLLRFSGIGEFDFKKLEITLDDAIFFLIQTHDISSQNPRLLKLKAFMQEMVEQKLEIDLAQLLKAHDQEFDKIQESYD